MVLVFRTSVTKESEIALLAPHLNKLTQGNGNWNFDLEDCDNILRIESVSLQTWEVIPVLQQLQFFCEELEDLIVCKA